MLGVDVIKQLAANLPRYTNNFTNNISVSTVSRSGTTVTVDTSSAHGLSVGSGFSMRGISVPVEIDTVSDNGTSWVITTLSDHDLTKNRSIPEVVTARITGASVGDESFTVVDVDNRREFEVTKGTNTPASGDFLQQQFLSGYNGFFLVDTVPSTTRFTYEITDTTLPDPNLSEGTVHGKWRISGAISFDIAQRAYTEQANDTDYWLFVVMEDTLANKDRKGTNDATSTRGRHQAWQQKIIEEFTLYLFVPAKGVNQTDVGGMALRDAAVRERLPILKSVSGNQFSSDLSCQGSYTTVYNGDSSFSYNGSFYVHEFGFQQVSNITNSDTSIESDSRAFRDIDFTIESLGIGSSTVDISADVDLDDEPL